MSWVMEVVTGGLVVSGGAEDVAVMGGVDEGPGDVSPPYVQVPSVPRGIYQHVVNKVYCDKRQGPTLGP